MEAGEREKGNQSKRKILGLVIPELSFSVSYETNLILSVHSLDSLILSVINHVFQINDDDLSLPISLRVAGYSCSLERHLHLHVTGRMAPPIYFSV